MKRLLITGAGGFIGYHLGNHFAGQGCQVEGVDIKLPAMRSVPQHPNFKIFVFDFRDKQKIEACLLKADVVFHLASAHLLINLEERIYWDVNVNSLFKLLSRSQKSGVNKFIHVSTVGIYGNLQEIPADENTPCTPQSIYGETKIAGEKEVRKFSERTGFSTVILRPTWVYGPGCPRTLKIYNMLRKRRFIMIGSGSNFRHPIYIEDMLKAFELSLEKDLKPGETFVIGGDHAISTKDLVSTFCNELNLPNPLIKIPHAAGSLLAFLTEIGFKIMGKEPPFSRRSLEFFDTNNAFEIKKARTMLGFDPTFTFSDGIRLSKKWLTENALKFG